MLISWIQRFSLIDFPWEVSCVVFTLWCNFRCGFCHNAEFVLPEKIRRACQSVIPEQAVFRFLQSRRDRLTWVSICGWEPTMQADLPEFCAQVKDMWFLVKLDTNGYNPTMLQTLINEQLIDYIAMDVKHEPWSMHIAAGTEVDETLCMRSIEHILHSEIGYEFRTTVIKWMHTKSSIENICRCISGARAYYLQNYRWWSTLDPDFKGESFSLWELEQFQQLSSQYVEYVWIRQ